MRSGDGRECGLFECLFESCLLGPTNDFPQVKQRQVKIRQKEGIYAPEGGALPRLKHYYKSICVIGKEIIYNRQRREPAAQKAPNYIMRVLPRRWHERESEGEWCAIGVETKNADDDSERPS
jgi:hypothetical protein